MANRNTPSAVRKLERAKEHIGNVEAALLEFGKLVPYEFGERFDAAADEYIYYLTKYTPFPPGIALIAGDAFQCLRSALDHIVWELLDCRSGLITAANERDVCLPISPSKGRYEASKGRRIIDSLPNAVKNAIDRIKPYHGGHRSLWMLNQLNNIDKHRALLIVDPAHHIMFNGLVFERLRGLADPLKLGDDVFGIAAAYHTQFHQNLHRIEVSVNLREAVAFGEPMLGLLQAMEGDVQALINRLKRHIL